MLAGVYARAFCFAAAVVHAAYIPGRHFHDYVKDGRSVDGPFPSNLKNMPYYCYQAPLKGPCESVFFVWFYDVVRRKCMPMFYSGCGGNENRFDSKNACENLCNRDRRI